MKLQVQGRTAQRAKPTITNDESSGGPGWQEKKGSHAVRTHWPRSRLAVAASRLLRARRMLLHGEMGIGHRHRRANA